MDNKKLADIADYLHELVRFRNNELVQKEEFNNFTEAEAAYYQDRTDTIYNLACEYDSKHEDHCDSKLMTLDEAIEHANDVAINELCTSCAAEHKQLADWLSELKDIKNKYAYLAADFDNYKKRTQRDQSEAFRNGKKEVVLKILDIYDDMQRLYNEIQKRNLIDDDDNIEVDYGPVDSGFEMIFEKFEKSLYNFGCEKLNVICGSDFDVELMEAISTRAIKDSELPETIVEIYQDGWKLDGKVVRPSKVIIGKKKEEEKEGNK